MNVITWIQEHLPFGINDWPSWPNELLGGALLTLALWALSHVHTHVFGHALDLRPYLTLVGNRQAAAQALSMFYEGFPDPNGWDRADVYQRATGCLIVEVLLWLL